MVHNTVLIFDEHNIVREALRFFLDSLDEFEVVGSSSSGADVLRMTSSLHPDLVIMELDMPGADGIAFVGKLIEADSDVKVIALTAKDKSESVKEFLTAGGKGYVLKTSNAQELLQAMRVVSMGGTYLDNVSSQRFRASLAEPEQSEVHNLSKREFEVIALVAQGLSAKAVGGRLGISLKTVDTYKTRAMDKLQLKNREELTRLAVEKGWLHS
jgi:two-component system, NarL family, response regulator NreC